MQTIHKITVNGRPVEVGTVDEARLAVMIGRVTQEDATIALAAARRKRAVDAIAEAFGSGKHTVAGVGEVTISQNVTYDGPTMVQALKPGQFMRASKRVIDNAKVKALYPAVYEAARRVHGWRAAARLYN